MTDTTDTDHEERPKGTEFDRERHRERRERAFEELRAKGRVD